MLGSDELYREWGYTALTRHRDSAKYYVTAPEPYRNRPAVSIQDKEELVETVVRTFEDSRKQELALEALERDPQAVHAVRELERQEQRARDKERRLRELQAEREQTPWYRREQRRELDRSLDFGHEQARVSGAEADRLRDDLDHLITKPKPRVMPIRARDPLAHAHWLDRAHDLGRDIPDHGLDIGL